MIEKKWLAEIKTCTNRNRCCKPPTNRTHKRTAERYDTTLSQLTNEVDLLTDKVKEHLKQMNYNMVAEADIKIRRLV